MWIFSALKHTFNFTDESVTLSDLMMDNGAMRSKFNLIVVVMRHATTDEGQITTTPTQTTTKRKIQILVL